MWYKTFLPQLHKILTPKNYIEIGIRHGYSLSLSDKAQKIAIDPMYDASSMEFDTPNTQFFKMTSDDFFDQNKLSDLLEGSFDLAYIDGMHLFEFALRDFINLEKSSDKPSIIIVDDVIPRNEEEANRTPTGGSWTGDVWKIIPCLTKYRPDLSKNMILTASEPTGCLIIVNPNSNDSTLSDNYEKIIDTYISTSYPTMPDKYFQNKIVSAEDALEQLIRLKTNK